MKQKKKSSIYLINELNNRIIQNNYLKKNKYILISISGGQDSICIFFLFFQLKKQWNWSFGIVYCNHLWQKNAFYTILLIIKLAYIFKIPVYCAISPNKIFNEYKSRYWRYSTFSRISNFYNYTIVTTGHTSSDKVETILFQLTRGTSTKSLTCLYPKKYFLSSNRFSQNIVIQISQIYNFKIFKPVEINRVFHQNYFFLIFLKKSNKFTLSVLNKIFWIQKFHSIEKIFIKFKLNSNIDYYFHNKTNLQTDLLRVKQLSSLFYKQRPMDKVELQILCIKKINWLKRLFYNEILKFYFPLIPKLSARTKFQFVKELVCSEVTLQVTWPVVNKLSKNSISKLIKSAKVDLIRNTNDKINYENLFYKWKYKFLLKHIQNILIDKNLLIRPELTLTRFDIKKLVIFWELPLYPDKTNQKKQYYRNRIRKQLLPTLRFFFNPQIDTIFLQFAEITTHEQLYLDIITNRFIYNFQIKKINENNILQIPCLTTNNLNLNKFIFYFIPLALQRKLLKQILLNYTCKKISFNQIEYIIQSINQNKKFYKFISNTFESNFFLNNFKHNFYLSPYFIKRNAVQFSLQTLPLKNKNLFFFKQTVNFKKNSFNFKKLIFKNWLKNKFIRMKKISLNETNLKFISKPKYLHKIKLKKKLYKKKKIFFLHTWNYQKFKILFLSKMGIIVNF